MSIKKFAVIGHPIGHTMSPFIHNRLFELSEIGSDDDFGERFVSRYSAKFNQISRKYADIDYLKQVLIPVLNEKASELLTQMTVGGF